MTHLMTQGGLPIRERVSYLIVPDYKTWVKEEKQMWLKDSKAGCETRWVRLAIAQPCCDC